MDPFYSFLAFALILAFELMATQSWLAVYFRFGIPVHAARRRLVQDVPTPETLDAAGLAKSLDERFKDRPGMPAIRFKPVAGGSSTSLAFHESLFDPHSRARYLPVMHSLARINPRQGIVTVTGYLDWYVLFILVYLVFSTIADRSFVFVDVVVALIFALSYFAQGMIDGMVAREIEAIITEKNGTRISADQHG